MNLLIVIDMQTEFHTTAAPIRQRVETIIAAHRGTTLFVEYQHCGRTYPSLIKAARHSHRVTKYSDDGAAEILQWLKGRHTPTKIRVIGVNTDCCVYDTVYSLRFSHRVEVIASGCNTWSDEFHRNALANLRQLRNVRVRETS